MEFMWLGTGTIIYTISLPYNSRMGSDYGNGPIIGDLLLDASSPPNKLVQPCMTINRGVGHHWHCSCVQNRSKSWIKQVFLYVLMFFSWIYTWYYTFYELNQKNIGISLKRSSPGGCEIIWSLKQVTKIFSALPVPKHTRHPKKTLANGLVLVR